MTEGLASSQFDPPSNSRQLRVLGASKDLGKHDLVQTYAPLVSLDFVYGFQRGARVTTKNSCIVEFFYF